MKTSYYIRKLILLLLILISVKSYSQIVWAPETAKWTYTGQGQDNSYIEIEYEKDSVVSGKLSKIFTKKKYIDGNYNGNISELNLSREITYIEDSVVYLYTYHQFDTLYAFNSNIGDSWTLYCYPNSGLCNGYGENAIVTVKDTGTVQINNINLRFIAVEYNFGDLFYDNYIYKVNDTIVERIGTINNYLLPWDILNIGLDANEGSWFRCYYDQQLGAYSNYNKPCDYLFTSINKIDMSEIKVYPIPCSTHLDVEFTNNTEKCLKIKDISGKDLLMQTIHEKKISIDLSSLPIGILFLEVTNKNSRIYKKLIKIK